MGADTFQREEFYDRPIRPPANWPALAFLILWGMGFGSAIFFHPLIGLVFGAIGLAAVIGGIRGLLAPLRGQVRGYRLDDRGLAELRLGQPERHWPWSAMREVFVGEQGARLVTDSGEVSWSSEVHGWRRLAQRLRGALVGEAAAEADGDLLDPAQVEGWLGVPAGGQLVVGTPSSERRTSLLLLPVWLAITLALCAFYGVFLWGFAHAPGLPRLGGLLFIGAHASIFFGVFSGGLGWKVYKGLVGGRAIAASGEGISLKQGLGWQHFGWDDVQSMALRDGAWQLSVGDEVVTIEPTWRNAAALIRAVRGVLDARSRGLRLPSGGGVSAAALSLARETGAVAAEQERGLSLVEPGE